MEDKIKFMKEALKRAKKGLAQGEVPVGAVIVHEGRVVSSGYNRRTKTQTAISHAEMYAIDRACKKFGSWRLPECDLYVTLEPCPMCMGAAEECSEVLSGFFRSMRARTRQGAAPCAEERGEGEPRG